MASVSEHPVLGVLEDMKNLIAGKANDYADNEDVYSNFRGAARIAGVSAETVFAVLVGVKIERLRQLMSGKEPNFESIEDTLLDLANYSALWLGFRREDVTYVKRLTNDQLKAHIINRSGGVDLLPGAVYTTDENGDIAGVPI